MKRQLYLEYLRAIATYAVILWHCVTNVYDQFGPLREWFPASITVGLLVRWSVPVFFMISGALLSLYVGLRSSAWAVARLERAVPSGSRRRPSASPGA